MTAPSPNSAHTPRCICLNPRDNVAIIVNDFGLPTGTKFACRLELRSFVPQGHKVALRKILQNAPIIRYGEIIGYAAEAILAGEWVDARKSVRFDFVGREINQAILRRVAPLQFFLSPFPPLRSPHDAVTRNNLPLRPVSNAQALDKNGSSMGDTVVTALCAF